MIEPGTVAAAAQLFTQIGQLASTARELREKYKNAEAIHGGLSNELDLVTKVCQSQRRRKRLILMNYNSSQKC